MLSEFLYLRLKTFLIYYFTPLYALSLFVFMALSYENEQYRVNLVIDELTNKVTGFKNPAYQDQRDNLLNLIWANLILTIIQSFVAYKILQGMGIACFQRFYSWLDFLLLFFNVSLFI